MAVTPTAPAALAEQSELARLRATLAAILGEPNLKTIEPAWLEKMRDGVIVVLHIGRTRGECELHEQEIGLAHADEEPAETAQRRQAWYQLGSKRVLPARYLTRLDSLDSSARKALARAASKTFWGAFLPAEAYATWKAQNEQYRAAYLAVGQELVDRYDAIVAEVCREHAALARDAYTRLCKQDRAFQTAHPDGAVYVAQQVATIRRLIPSAAHIRAALYFEVELLYIPLPSLLAEDMATAARIRDEAGAAAELRREVYRIAREEKERLISGFMRDLILKIQQMLYAVSVDVLSSVRANRKVGGKSAEQLRHLLGGLEQYLSFAPNDDVAQILEQVRGFLDLAPGKERQAAVPTLERQLEAVALLARDVLLRLGATPRSARDLGIPDAPPPALLRTARRTLDLDPPEVAPAPALQPPRVLRPLAQAAADHPLPVGTPR